MLKTTISGLLALVLLAMMFVHLTAPAAAANTSCVAEPREGPPGTIFTLTASGFDPNSNIFLYAVEPDGTAFADPTYNAFGGGARADERGVVTFTFRTRFEVQGFIIARALGTWTLVAQQLGLGGATVHQANCIVNLTSGGGQILTGAVLRVTPATAQVGTDVWVEGSGFGANETVNLWVSPPAYCSSFAFTLPDVLYQYAGASAFTQDNVYTSGGGQFLYRLPTFSFFNCTGDWAISAYAPQSGAGAIATFTLVGNSVPGGASLFVNRSTAFSRDDVLTFTGFGFTPNSVVSCWTTRPEGTVRFVGNFDTNNAGAFTFSFRTGFDLEDDFDGDGAIEHLHYSEGSVGTYAMTCRDNVSGATGTVNFILSGMASDP